MAKRKQKNKKNNLKDFFGSKLIIIIGLVLLILIGSALAKELMRKHEINKEIAEVEQEIERLERKNNELNSLIEYLNTEEFKEIQARQSLSLQKEGETAIALTNPVQPNIQEEEVLVEEVDDRSNIRRWWDYFFSKNKK